MTGRNDSQIVATHLMLCRLFEDGCDSDNVTMINHNTHPACNNAAAGYLGAIHLKRVLIEFKCLKNMTFVTTERYKGGLNLGVIILIQ